MVDFITNWLGENDIDYHVDTNNNVYATKNTGDELPHGFYYPCVISHTDTVHRIDTINVVESILPNSQGDLKKALLAINDIGEPTGIGGDDKCGVFACLTLLKELPYLKAAFFVSEETGCHGSRKADMEFFSNVGYAIQFDAPENYMVTEKCFGSQLFDRDSEFFTKIDKVLTENMVLEDMDYMTHPYTDVWALRNKFDFACINFSIGYYNYHTKNEYVIPEDVYNGIKMGREMIDSLGYTLHYKEKHTMKDRFTLWD
jgi:di/tripeptidase